MARGFVSGAALGLVVSTVAAGGLSLAIGFPEGTDAPGLEDGADVDAAALDEAEVVESPGEAAPMAPDTEEPDTESEDDVAALEGGGEAPEIEGASGDGAVTMPEDRAAPDAATAPTSEPVVVTEEAEAEAEPASDDLAEAETADVASDTAADDTIPTVEEREVGSARRPGEETEVARTDGPSLDAPDDARADDVAGGDTAPLDRPQAGAPDSALDAPGESGSGARVAVSTDAPVMTAPSADGPSMPAPESGPDVQTDPGQPPAPTVPEDESGLVSDAGAGEDPADGTTAAAVAERSPVSDDEDADDPETGETGNAQAVEEADVDMPSEAEGVNDEEADSAADIDMADPETAPEPAEMAEATTGSDGSDVTDADADVARDEPSEEPGIDPTEERLPGETTGPNSNVAEAGDMPAEGEDAPSGDGPAIGEMAGSIIDRNNAVPVNRPGDDAAPEADEADEAAEDTAPVQRYAASRVPTEGQPAMSIVLIDDGTGPLGPDALDAFPFPVTFAVDPGLPDAEARMRGYRDQGFEVMTLAAVPQGAGPQDVEVALEAALTGVPEAVGVLEAPGGGLQGSRAVSDQLASVLGDTGHGLLVQSNGLNTGQQLAERAGVPSATVFRDFDGDGQDPRVQRRFLDQAAFRARQEGAVIMLGRLRADTVSALLLWSLQDRAGQVALVPASQVLRGDLDDPDAAATE
ncbi:divergent polysaccharide deacetylase family protein [Roseivivax marinus]|uniref:divergent polysaccharide deacetylase family protein n=1 Tax=Roseivivax marinus TaxID=1379903 RepID=UPI001F042D5F|nr:divergent polysaccharide deacetylase family protein [Roseivivax marinus]UMA66136.1 divergent polysaccharide deacetylase family protein [Roseivivax marinus]